jgi:hypothetical protein
LPEWAATTFFELDFEPDFAAIFGDDLLAAGAAFLLAACDSFFAGAATPCAEMPTPSKAPTIMAIPNFCFIR